MTGREFDLIKDSYETSTAHGTRNCGTPNATPPVSRTRQTCPLQLSIQHDVRVLARAKRQGKQTNSILTSSETVYL